MAASGAWARALLLRTLPLWQARGFAVAVLTPPNGMSLLGYRHTEGYAAAIGQAVDHLKWRRRPSDLAGRQQPGAIAAVGAAARLGAKVAGIVVLSSVTGRSGAGETLFDSEPGQVTVPVLIVANKGDTCPASPPGDAAKIAEALSPGAAQGNSLLGEHDDERAALRRARRRTGYFGIEQETVDRIARVDRGGAAITSKLSASARDGGSAVSRSGQAEPLCAPR